MDSSSNNLHIEPTEMGVDEKEQTPLSDPDPESSTSRERNPHNPNVKTALMGMGSKILVVCREKFSGLKRYVDNQRAQYGRGTNADNCTRVYQVWPGNNVFFCGGRLICGPDPRGLLATTISIVLSSWIFVVYNGCGATSHSGLRVVPFAILTTIVLANLFLVSTTDPGIIPRNNDASMDGDIEANAQRRRRVTINGVELKLKYCRICKLFRPPRSCHCAVCDNCVERFDHHCPWIGQCVALRNYRFYLAFVASALVLFGCIFAFTCQRIHRQMLQSGYGPLGILRDCPETLALVLFSFAALVLLSGLASFHIYLIATNQTAYENFHQRHAANNPFNKGALKNVKEILLLGLPPSRIDFLAEVPPPRPSQSNEVTLKNICSE